jgi:hypothetical protein
MQLTSEEGRLVIDDDHDDWAKVKEEIIDTRRWSVRYLGVFSHKPSGRFYQMAWSVGATEQQDEQPFEFETPELEEVVEKETLVKTWVKL